MIRKQKQMQTQRVESFLNERNSPILSLCLSSFLLSFSQFDGRGGEGGEKKTGRGAAVAAAHKDEKREEERGEKGRTTFGRFEPLAVEFRGGSSWRGIGCVSERTYETANPARLGRDIKFLEFCG